METYKQINRELVGQVQEMRINIEKLQKEILSLHRQLLEERRNRVEDQNGYIGLMTTKFIETIREIKSDLNIIELVQHYEDDIINENTKTNRTTDIGISCRDAIRKTDSLASRKSAEIVKTLQQSNDITNVRRSVVTMSPTGFKKRNNLSLNNSSEKILYNNDQTNEDASESNNDNDYDNDADYNNDNDDDDDEEENDGNDSDEVEICLENSVLENTTINQLEHITEEDSIDIELEKEIEDITENERTVNSDNTEQISITSSPLSDLTNSPTIVNSTRKKNSFRNRSINAIRFAQQSSESVILANISNIKNMENKSYDRAIEENSATTATTSINMTFKNVACSTPKTNTKENLNITKQNIEKTISSSSTVISYNQNSNADENSTNSSTTRPKRNCSRVTSYKEIHCNMKQRNENAVHTKRRK